LNRYGRACPGHPAEEGKAVPHDRDRRVKPGDDGACVQLVRNILWRPALPYLAQNKADRDIFNQFIY
jgi:hypothetical protein